MKFSCVMTAYNEGALLAQSIASVLNQTHRDLELVIVDDGATDETRAVLQAQCDPRIVLLEQSNDGLSAARNRGLRHCSGDYICFLDGDDLRAPWGFAEVAAALRDTPVELLLVGGVLSQPQGRLLPFMDEGSAIGAADAAREAALLADQDRENNPDAPDGQGGRDGQGAKGTAALDLAATKAWAASFEPQSANKFISAELLRRARLSFPNDHFFEDILFHALAIAHARSVTLLPGRSFTYFRRQYRPQVTGGSSETRFDVIGTTGVMFQLLARHPEFANAPFRGAVSIGALRLLKWCEERIARHQLGAYRAALRATFAGVDARFFIISPETPDPRGERQRLQRYAQNHLLA